MCQKWKQLPFFYVRQPGSNWTDWITLKYIKNCRCFRKNRKKSHITAKSALHTDLYSWVYCRGKHVLPSILTSYGSAHSSSWLQFSLKTKLDTPAGKHHKMLQTVPSFENLFLHLVQYKIYETSKIYIT